MRREKQRREGPLTFFVDECLKCSLIHQAIDRALLHNERVEVAPKSTPDTVWLPRTGRQGWVCLSKDRKLSTRPNEVHAIIEHGVGLVMCPEGSGLEHAQMIVEALPVIRRAVRTLARAFVTRIDGGNLVILYEDGKKLARARVLKRRASEQREAEKNATPRRRRR